MTRRELLDDFLGFTTEQGDSTARDVSERLLNRALLSIYLKRPWRQFQAAAPYQFTTVNGTRDYVLPSHVGRFAERLGPVRNLTNGVVIGPIGIMDLQTNWPMFGTSLETRATPRYYVLGGTSGVATQPSSTGDACEVLSSSASDTTVVVYVEGFDASGVYQRTQVTLTGTTAVAVGTWSRIERFGKSYPASLTPTSELTSSVGTVTLRTVSGPTTLELLYTEQSSVEHPIVTLAPTPDAAYVIAAPYQRGLPKVYQDGDPIPEMWGNALFEEMKIQWEVNKGTIPLDSGMSRPHLIDLMQWDEAQRVSFLQHKRPYQ